MSFEEKIPVVLESFQDENFCCFCYEPCSMSSQACGRCMHNGRPNGGPNQDKNDFYFLENKKEQEYGRLSRKDSGPCREHLNKNDGNYAATCSGKKKGNSV